MADLTLRLLLSPDPEAKCIDQYALLPSYVSSFVADAVNALEPDGKTFLYGYFDPTGVTLEKVIKTNVHKGKPAFKPKPKPHGESCKCLTCTISVLETSLAGFKHGFPDPKVIDEHLTFYTRKPGWHSQEQLWVVIPFFVKVAWYCSTKPINDPPSVETDGYEGFLASNLAEKYGYVPYILVERVGDQTKSPTSLVANWSQEQMPVSQLISPDIQPGVLDLETKTLSLKPGFHLRTRKDMEKVSE